MIEIRHCSKAYGNQSVLKDVTVSFPDRGFFAVIGKSGSGKTTLLNLLADYDRPDTGEVLVDGVSYSEMSERERENVRKNDIGFIFQDFFLIDDMTVADNIRTAEIISAENAMDEEAADKLLDRLGIREFKEKYPNELSGGERQRTAIARAIAKGCKIILADEPTGNLDADNSEKLYSLLKELSRDYLVVMVTHDAAGRKYADHVIDMTALNGAVLDFVGEEREARSEAPKRWKRGNPKAKFSFGRRLFKKKKRVFISSLIVFALLMLFDFVVTNFALINPHETEYRIYADNGVQSVSYFYAAGGKTLEDVPDYGEKYDKLGIKKYVSVSLPLAQVFSDKWSVDAQPGYTDTLRYIILDDSVSDGEIAVSGYIAECLLHLGIFETQADILGQPCFTLLGETFTADGIDPVVLEDASEHQQDIRVNYIRMSYASFVKFRDYRLYEVEEEKLIDISDSDSGNNYAIARVKEGDVAEEGTFPNGGDEVALSVSYVEGAYGSENPVGSEIALCGKTYRISGVLSNPELLRASLIFSDEEYERLAENYALTLERSGAKGFTLSLSDKGQAVSLMKEMYGLGLFANSDFRKEAGALVDDLYIIKDAVIFFSAFVLLVSICLFCYIYANAYKSFRRESAVLVSLGANAKDVGILIDLPVLLLFFGALAVSLAGYFIAVPLVGKALAGTVSATVSLAQYRLAAIPIVFLLFVASCLLSGAFMRRKWKKRSVLDILYNRY